ncbi:MAG: DnaJ C-terminal domain-containing protein [Patescibacteria group bacterium]
MENDYYKTLGITKSAAADEIKKAYRKLALQYHPDRNKTKDGDKKFKEVTAAYEVLSDPQKKQAYDQFGHQAFTQGGAGGGPQGPFGGGFGGQQGGQYGPFTYTYGTAGGGNPDFDFGGFSDPFDIFEQFFGGGGFSQRQRRQSYSLTIDFMDAVKGATKKVTIDGKNQTIKIPAGVDNGSRIRFGDYDVVLNVSPDERYRRENYDLITEISIPFVNAALGETITAPTIDGEIKVKVPQGTQPDTVIRLKNRGVPHLRGSGRGDQYLRIKVVIPKNLSNHQKKLLQEFEEESKKKKTWF